MVTNRRVVPVWVLRSVEWVAVFVGAAGSVWVAVVFGSQQFNNLWPTPGLYLLEIVILGLIALFSRLVDTGAVSFDYGAITWVVSGALLAFVILGGFSIGPFIFPSMIAFALAAACGDLRQGRKIPVHIGYALVAAVAQAALIAILLILSRVGYSFG